MKIVFLKIVFLKLFIYIGSNGSDLLLHKHSYLILYYLLDFQVDKFDFQVDKFQVDSFK